MAGQAHGMAIFKGGGIVGGAVPHAKRCCWREVSQLNTGFDAFAERAA
jgi:hypothetical protein